MVRCNLYWFQPYYVVHDEKVILIIFADYLKLKPFQV